MPGRDVICACVCEWPCFLPEYRRAGRGRAAFRNWISAGGRCWCVSQQREVHTRLLQRPHEDATGTFGVRVWAEESEPAAGFCRGSHTARLSSPGQDGLLVFLLSFGFILVIFKLEKRGGECRAKRPKKRTKEVSCRALGNCGWGVSLQRRQLLEAPVPLKQATCDRTGVTGLWAVPSGNR